MITVNHVLSSRILPSKIFEDLYFRNLLLAPEGFRLTQSVRANSQAMIRHYHRPHREWRLINPAVVTMHHDPREGDPYLNASRFLPAWKSASKVICLNSTQQQFLLECGIEGSVVIPHGVDRQVFPMPATPRHAPSGKIVLGLVSKRYERGVKGEEKLSQLMDYLDPRQFSFIFLGQGRWQEAVLASQKGFDVEHYESLPYTLFGEAYAKMSALLLLSEYEGGPACLPEALGSGLPIIATPVGMVIDWVKDGVNGIVLKPDSWLEQVDAVSKDPQLLMRLNQGAFQTAHTFPSWQESIARQFAVYLEIIGSIR